MAADTAGIVGAVDEPREILIPKPSTSRCEACHKPVVRAFDRKLNEWREFDATPHQGKFLIRNKPLSFGLTRWEATWWGPSGGEYQLHECSGEPTYDFGPAGNAALSSPPANPVTDGPGSWSFMGIGRSEDRLADIDPDADQGELGYTGYGKKRL